MSNIILIGFMGAGKTTLGIELSKELGLPFVDTDQQIEEEQRRTISDIFAKEGEMYFRSLETQQLKSLLKGPRSVISVGGGLPVQRENHALLKQLGTTIYLKAAKETLVKRLQGSVNRPLLQGGGLAERIETLMASREPIYLSVADIIYETDGQTPKETVKHLKKLLQA